MSSPLNKLLLIASALLLTSCGGGSSTSSATVASTQAAITVTLSSSSASIYESSSSVVTITATLSRVASSNVSVGISTSGTATEGTDYSEISDITITAGSTTGTATLNPTSDTTYESNNETVIISISSVTGGGASESGTQSVTITINEHALNSGTTLTYSSSNATTQAATAEFKYINYSSAASSQNPLEVINAHRAYGYGLTGSGKTIAILDSGFYTGHQELDNKTITTYGTVDAATGISSSADHGLFVSSVAAGEDDGSGLQGVAPAASLHIADYTNLNGETYLPNHWANATDNASSAVVQNNSWGIDYQIDTLQSDISSNNWTNDYGIAQKWNSSGYTANEESATSYITALNNFQEHGVIVYALSNTSSYTDADFQAALPVLFSQLNEAWITAVNIEITGSSGNETYTRKSAPCGSTASYCLGADGWELNGAAYSSNGTNYYWQGASGTSLVAPQISGAVALLAEAFPNHTPSQLTDRLLASADNTFYTHSAEVAFANGIKHGFNTEYGHGVMDIYAALNPITTSSSTRVLTGDSIFTSPSFQLNASRLSTSRSFGDSLRMGLKETTAYTYDDLNGGFKYDLSSQISLSTTNAPSVNLNSELTALSDSINNLVNPKRRQNYNQELVNLSSLGGKKAVLTVGASSPPVQSFFDSNLDSSTTLANYQTPFLDPYEGGIGVGSSFEFSNSRLLLGATIPIEEASGITIGLRKSVVASFEYGKPSEQSLTIMAGVTRDKDTLLGSRGTEGFTLNGSKSNTVFSAIKAQKQISDYVSLVGIATHANTNLKNSNESLIDSASGVKSSSIALIGNIRNISGDDHLSVYVSQPNRVNSGSIAFRLGGLADSNGSISYNKKDVELLTSGRQIDYGLFYRRDFSEGFALSVKHMITKNLNHQKHLGILHSSYIGIKYQGMKFGLSTVPVDSSINSEFSYLMLF